MTRTILPIGTAFALLFGSQALAADFGSLKDEPVVEAPTWSGHYVGGSVGYGRNRSTNEYVDDSPDYSSVRENADGGFVSAVMGIDRQVHDRFVIGAFLEYDLSDLERGSGTDALTIDRQLFIGGRLGVLMRPDLLAFVSGGYTRAHFDNEGWWDLDNPGKNHVNFNGYFIGGGFELLLRGNLSLRGEVRYSDFGEEITNAGSCCGGLNYIDKEDPSIWSGRIGFNYRFGRNGHPVTGGVDEDAQSFISYHGFDIGRRYQYGYSGVMFALNGDWDKDGFVFRSQTVIGSYDFNGSNGIEIDATDRAGDVMIGYQFVKGNLSAIAMVGMEVRDVDLSPDDPAEELRGTETGFKAAVEIETDSQSPFYFNLDTSYSTAFDTFAAAVRIGARKDGFVFGPEGSFYREVGDNYYRAGAFVMVPVKILADWGSELTFNGGYQFVQDDADNTGSRSEGAYFGTKLVLTY